MPRILARELYLATCGLPFDKQLEEIFPEDPRNADASAEFEGRKPALCGAIRMPAETRRALQEMRDLGVRIAVSSNNGIENVNAFARDAGFKFDLVLGYGDGLAKGRAHLDATPREFGAARQEMLFVGDSLHDGEIAEREGHPVRRRRDDVLARAVRAALPVRAGDSPLLGAARAVRVSEPPCRPCCWRRASEAASGR